jgi:hypothetical protein
MLELKTYIITSTTETTRNTFYAPNKQSANVMTEYLNFT